MDRLQVVGSDERQERRCVACGHRDSLESTASQEPKTRVTGGPKNLAEAEVARPVRIVEAGDPEGPSRT